jgi:hypothetical protein
MKHQTHHNTCQRDHECYCEKYSESGGRRREIDSFCNRKIMDVTKLLFLNHIYQGYQKEKYSKSGDQINKNKNSGPSPPKMYIETLYVDQNITSVINRNSETFF